MPPLISCVVPVFNGEAYLGGALDSILGQSYRPIEVIVIDDGSGDASPEIAQGRGPLVRVLAQQNRGPAASRNRGVSEARGDHLAFLDQDDLWHPEKLSRQYERFRLRPELSVCWTHVRLFWTDEVAEEGRRYADHPRGGTVPGYATTTMLARREVFEAVGPLDETLWFSDSTDWVLRAREAGLAMEMLDEALTFHRMHPANLTRRQGSRSREEFLQIAEGALARRAGRPPGKARQGDGK